MGTLRFWRDWDGYREMVNTDTGEIKKIKLATEKQMKYLNSLRDQVGKPPVKGNLMIHQAVKQIDKLVEKTKQQRLL